MYYNIIRKYEKYKIIEVRIILIIISLIIFIILIIILLIADIRKIIWIDITIDKAIYKNSMKYFAIYDITEYFKEVKFYGIQNDIIKINIFKIFQNKNDYIVQKSSITKDNFIQYSKGYYTTFDAMPLEEIINTIIEIDKNIKIIEQKNFKKYENCIKYITKNDLFTILK